MADQVSEKSVYDLFYPIVSHCVYMHVFSIINMELFVMLEGITELFFFNPFAGKLYTVWLNIDCIRR